MCRLYTVIAVDPGVTTGYAIGELDEPDGFMRVVTGQERMDHKRFWEFLNYYKPDMLICERFEFRNKARTGLELFSRELIGIAHLYIQIVNGGDESTLFMQQPGPVIGGFFSKPENMGNVYKKGKIHANEAAMHLLHWYKFGPGFKYWKKGFESAA